MIDRKKVERALEIADGLRDLAHVNIYLSEKAQEKTEIELCVHPETDPAPDELINRILGVVPKIQRRKGMEGNIMGSAWCDGIEITLYHLDKCRRVEDEVEVPELERTGKMITQKRVRYLCPEDVQ